MRKLIVIFIVWVISCSSLFAQPFGSAILLNGTNDFISIPNTTTLNITNNLTLEAWVKPCDLTGHNIIFTKLWCSGNQYSYYFTIQNGKLKWVWSTNGSCSSSANVYESTNVVVLANTWQHVAVVHTSIGVTLYLNGVVVTGSLNSGAYSLLPNSTEPLRIGAYRNLSGVYALHFGGLLDEARVWDTSLTSTTIFSRYNSSLVGNEANLVAYYPMNGTGSGNGVVIANAATATGTALNGTTIGVGTSPFFSTGLPLPILGSDTTICSGSSYLLDVTTSGGSYLWQDGSTSSTYSVSQTDTITVDLSIVNGCINSDTVIVMVDTLNIDLGNDTLLCVGQSIVLDAISPNATYTWQDGSTDSTFTVTQFGVYWVEVINLCDTVYDTINVGYVNPSTINLGNDTVICSGQSLVLDATNPNATYSWQNSSTNATFTVTLSGIYWVKMTTICDTVSDTIQVNVVPPANINLGNDTVLCFGQSLILGATVPNATYSWQNSSTNSTFTVTQPGIYWIEVITICDTVSDTINVGYLNPITINLGNDTVLCTGQSTLLDATVPNATYVWQNGSTSSTYTVTQSGTYWVNVTTPCGIVSDTIQVNYLQFSTINIGNDTVICDGQNLILNANTANATYLWQDNSNAPTLLVSSAGNYWVEVTVGNCKVKDSINVILNFPPVVNIGNDTSLCDGEVLVLDASSSNGVYSWQDGLASPLFVVSVPGNYWVEVTNLCGTVKDEVFVSYTNLDVNLGNDSVLCPNQLIVLDAQNANATYLWQDGSIASKYEVTKPGLYWVEVRVGNCLDSDTISIMESNVEMNIGPDTTLCLGIEIAIGFEFPNSTYLWQDNSTESYVDVNKSGIYILELSNSCGQFSDTAIVNFEDCNCYIYIPNAFHPNGNGMNDVFKPEYQCAFENYLFIIYDRWGQIMFETSNPVNGWDGMYNGNMAPQAMYSYVLSYYHKGTFKSETSSVLLIGQ